MPPIHKRPRYDSLTVDQRVEIVNGYLLFQLSIRTLAQEFDCAYATVHRVLTNACVPMRPRGSNTGFYARRAARAQSALAAFRAARKTTATDNPANTRRRKAWKVSTDDRADIVEAYQTYELPSRIIAQEFGCGLDTVQRVIADAGVPPRPCGPTPGQGRTTQAQRVERALEAFRAARKQRRQQ